MFGRNIRTEVGPPRWNRSGRRDCAGEVEEEGEEAVEVNGNKRPDRAPSETDCESIPKISKTRVSLKQEQVNARIHHLMIEKLNPLVQP